MDLYTTVAYDASKLITKRYSSSFGYSTRLFPRIARRHIYALYGLVRIADEIVDTYAQSDAEMLLRQLEQETYSAIKKQYSVNPIVHSFAVTAQLYDIGEDLIAPFFASMCLDASPKNYTQQLYKDYIHGSAEVVGLMCLKIFCSNNAALYLDLEPGARALGSAYQKVNFLRDFAEDFAILGRVYFPGYSFESFDDAAKSLVIKDIEVDFANASDALKRLPKKYRLAVRVSLVFYTRLLNTLRATPIETLKTTRVRVSTVTKIWLLVKTIVIERVRHGF